MEIQLPQILFQIVNFSVVVGALTYLLFKPVQKILDERSNKIAEAQKAAQAVLEEKDAIETLKKQSKRDAEKAAAAILDEAKKDADVRSQELIQKTQEHGKAQLTKLQAEWQNEKKEMVKELKAQFTDAVIATSAKVLGEKLDSKAHSKLIDQEMNTILKAL